MSRSEHRHLTRLVGVRVTPDQLTAAQALAEHLHTTVPSLIRDLLDDLLAKISPANPPLSPPRPVPRRGRADPE